MWGYDKKKTTKLANRCFLFFIYSLLLSNGRGVWPMYGDSQLSNKFYVILFFNCFFFIISHIKFHFKLFCRIVTMLEKLIEWNKSWFVVIVRKVSWIFVDWTVLTLFCWTNECGGWELFRMDFSSKCRQKNMVWWRTQIVSLIDGRI